MESVENQERVSHAFHRPLEISQKARDSHIPTARLRVHGKVENQKQVSHFPTTARDHNHRSLSENQKPKKGSRPLRGLLIPCPIFMLILRLENAPAAPPQRQAGSSAARPCQVPGLVRLE